MPEITNAMLIGNNKIDSVLSVALASDSIEPITAEYHWYRSSIYDGIYEEIPGESLNKYTIKFGDVYIKCLVIGTGSYTNQIYTNIVVVDVTNYSSSSSNSIAKISSVGNGLSYFSTISTVSGMSNIVADVARINQSIQIILSTAKGEVPMIPELGCDLHIMLFEGVTDTQLDLIKLEAQTAIISQEPRINLMSVNVDYDGDHTVSIRVEYNIKNTNIKSSYIYNADTEGGGNTFE